jgi:hypothetical protein
MTQDKVGLNPTAKASTFSFLHPCGGIFLFIPLIPANWDHRLVKARAKVAKCAASLE